ncbi:hypothetical protein PHYPSEUDO_011119 [Phytophthora pseudosyringae]|uniref:Uncharacterized protein n=1 Tax=Phytophthora pseudosyringae TaxID=221518 RepID=A0A8T1V8T9_9STRA|nr:hypothetical protein PHYPSEUDO_011119 [Phytophthora pseudosyringae]
MSAAFPFVGPCAWPSSQCHSKPSLPHRCIVSSADPFARLENALWSVFHCRSNGSLAAVLTSLWEIWSLQPTLHHRVLTSRSALVKVVVLRILRAARSIGSLPIDQLARVAHCSSWLILHSRLTPAFCFSLTCSAYAVAIALLDRE